MDAFCQVPVRTWHIHGAVPVRPASDTKLAIAVVAPALDASSRDDDARMPISRGDRDGREA